ncbi:sigma-70 family RNA polymerase sigma factor [Xanthomonas sp. AM6]|uniref:RNA polymerase sigma factor n=1 Tax=Xanthomonas sp. AM6 TaxID=2982531 RepID=UPI0021DA497D|nr:sigma-70 family RNA polymerase sigma factor [Xanthomonas sp. AM6]UYB52026.1 sigma-70 family RNA polymerase sigma factor [Xanthomonas sp. AM6]
MSPSHPAPETDRDIAATVLRERSRLGNFIRRRVLDRADAEDILQDVLSEFVQAYRLPAPIEQASAWLFQVARNRIIDRFRKRRAQPPDARIGGADEDGDDDTLRLDLELPAPDGGPEAAYARASLLAALQQALDELPDTQREVFVAHEFEGRSFRQMADDSGIAINTLLARKRYAVLYLRARLQAAYDELES